MNTERNSIQELVQLQTKQVLQIQGLLSKALVLVLAVGLLILTREVALDMVDMVLEVIQVVVATMVQALDKVNPKFIILTRLVTLRGSGAVEALVVMVQLLAWALDLHLHNQVRWHPNLTV